MMNWNPRIAAGALAVAVLAVAVLALAACSNGAKPDVTKDVSASASASLPTAAAELASPLASPLNSPLPDAMTIGMAGIDKVTLLVEAAKPSKLVASVKGYLGDACTSLGAVTQSREGNTIKVTVGTLRPTDRICAQMVKDFEVIVPVKTDDLSVGSYVVDVNGASASFEVDANGPKVP